VLVLTPPELLLVLVGEFTSINAPTELLNGLLPLWLALIPTSIPLLLNISCLGYHLPQQPQASTYDIDSLARSSDLENFFSLSTSAFKVCGKSRSLGT
jgi:hypothetical protein